MTPSQTSGVEALARPTKETEGLSATPMMSVQSAPMAYGQQDFLCQAEGEQGHAVLDLLELIAAFVDVETVGDVPVLDDGAGDELGEHDDVSTEINDVMLRFHIPAVDVDGVGKCLEGVEADAQRQYADALNGRQNRCRRWH